MKKWLVLSLLCLLASSYGTADAANVYVFGDSLSDTGNFSIATLGALPPAPLYYSGRFSNGPVWVEGLAQQLGHAGPTPSLAGGTNFAFNGARVLGASPYMTPDLTTQANLFVASLGGGTPAADDLFVVWGGANDLIFALTGQVPAIAPGDVVQNLSGVISLLAGAGAKQFIVPNLPPLGQTPFFNTTPLAPVLDAAADDFNTQLAAELESLEASLGILIHELDAHELFAEAIADPASFGLTNVTDSATIFDPLTGLGIAPDAMDPNDFLFFDGVHPSATGHGILADRAFVLVTPEPRSVVIWILVGVVTFAGTLRVRTRHREANFQEC